MEYGDAVVCGTHRCNDEGDVLVIWQYSETNVYLKQGRLLQ